MPFDGKRMIYGGFKVLLDASLGERLLSALAFDGRRSRRRRRQRRSRTARRGSSLFGRSQGEVGSPFLIVSAILGRGMARS
jgi:hypothetical protein